MSQAVQAISADSRICESEEYFARIDSAFENRRPRAIHDERDKILRDNAALLYGIAL